MATSGRGSVVVGYNVQIAVEADHHLIVMHGPVSVSRNWSRIYHYCRLSQRPNFGISFSVAVRRKFSIKSERGALVGPVEGYAS
jgi:hypothetical protein